MCLAFTLLHGFTVDVHCCSDVGMTHQFLLHLERSPSLVKKTPERVAECVPTDAAYAAADSCGTNMSLLHLPGLPRHGAPLEGTREDPGKMRIDMEAMRNFQEMKYKKLFCKQIWEAFEFGRARESRKITRIIFSRIYVFGKRAQLPTCEVVRRILMYGDKLKGRGVLFACCKNRLKRAVNRIETTSEALEA